MRRTLSVFPILPLLGLLALVVAVPANGAENGIPPGTVITLKNWQKYKQFMPDGMQVLFAGSRFWKLPPDFRMEVGPTHHYLLPKVYLENTEKYSKLVKIVNLPDGGHSISGYVAGQPFPNPQNPLKGWKILVDEWFRSLPWLICGKHNYLHLKDRFGNVSTDTFFLVYRQLDYISAPDQPTTDPASQGVYYSEFLMIMTPEQAKYTAQLTLHYANPAKPEDLFLFIPALRRTIRLSSAARCSPVTGTDFTQDDVRYGYNGGIVRFGANYVRDQNVLTLISSSPALYGKVSDPRYYYPQLFFPKPSVGKWELRDVYVIDVSRIPSQRSGYCYSKREMHIDKETFVNFWNDLYDNAGRLWKIDMANHFSGNVPTEGFQLETGSNLEIMWDQENGHMTAEVSSGPQGIGLKQNEACRNYEGTNFTDVHRWNTVQGLAQIMR